MTNTLRQTRYTWIDYAKFISIFLVVYFHTPPALPLVTGKILILLMLPMFFFLSGLLFDFEKYTSFISFLKHRVKLLLTPYFCFFLLFYAYWLLIGKSTGNPDDSAAPLYQPLLEYLYGVPNLVCMPLWFIPCLLAIQSIYFIVFRNISRRLSTILLFLFPFIPIIFDLSNAPASLGMACNSLPFYGIASLYRKEIMRFIEQSNNLLKVGFIGLAIHVIIGYYLVDLTSEYTIFIKLVGSFASFIPVMVLSKYIANLCGQKRIIEEISRNTITILAFHTYSIIIMMRLLLLAFPEEPDFFDGKYTLKLIMASIALVSMVIPIYFINKYTPFVLGKSK